MIIRIVYQRFKVSYKQQTHSIHKTMTNKQIKHNSLLRERINNSSLKGRIEKNRTKKICQVYFPVKPILSYMRMRTFVANGWGRLLSKMALSKLGTGKSQAQAQGMLYECSHCYSPPTGRVPSRRLAGIHVRVL